MLFIGSPSRGKLEKMNHDDDEPPVAPASDTGVKGNVNKTKDEDEGKSHDSDKKDAHAEGGKSREGAARPR